jgi:hypothetical protein
MAIELREKADASASDIVGDTKRTRAELTGVGDLVLDPLELPAELVILLGELPDPLCAGSVEYQLNVVPRLLGLFDQSNRIGHSAEIAMRLPVRQ